MRSVAIRDMRRRWSEAEAALAVEGEILITRNFRPIAKLVRVVPDKGRRKRWNPEAHAAWPKKVWGNRTMPSSHAALAESRSDRTFTAERH